MARRKNYAKQLELLEKKLGDLNGKYDAAKETMEKLEEEREQIQQEISDLKIQKLQQLMADRNVTVDELTRLLEERE